MEGIDYLEDALKAMNTGAANLNSKTLAQINAMNIELKNADGSLAGKYKLSEFLENVIYSYLSTTKASSLASVLGGLYPQKGGGFLPNDEDADNILVPGIYCSRSQNFESMHLPSQYGILIVLNIENEAYKTLQIWFTSTLYACYIRLRTANEFNAWKKFDLS